MNISGPSHITKWMWLYSLHMWKGSMPFFYLMCTLHTCQKECLTESASGCPEIWSTIWLISHTPTFCPVFLAVCGSNSNQLCSGAGGQEYFLWRVSWRKVHSAPKYPFQEHSDPSVHRRSSWPWSREARKQRLQEESFALLKPCKWEKKFEWLHGLTGRQVAVLRSSWRDLLKRPCTGKINEKI